MTSKEFWGLVEDEKARLIAEHKARAQKAYETNDPAAYEGQPEHGHSLFIVSKPRRGSAEKPRVCEAPIRLAAQRIVEDSHEIAKPEQIAEHLAERKEYGEMIASMEAKLNNGPRAIFVKPAEAPIKGKK